jgi:23S rRNA pseudoU1915 N3-methylase RlmH
MIKIVAVDKIKEKSLRSMIDIYLERLSGKLRIDIIEITPAKYHTFDNIEKAKDIEGERIERSLGSRVRRDVDCFVSKARRTLAMTNTEIPNKDNSLVIALSETGSFYSSLDFSKLIYRTLPHKHICFIIGGAYGLSERVLALADIKLSLSKMTFTHEMCRLFLIEQIYRGYTISEGIKYHN